MRRFFAARYAARWPIGLRASSEFEAIYGNMQYEPSDFTSIQPRHMSIELLPFQKEGVGWLIDRERKTSGGIMCDHLGMGKTVQMIGLCVEAGYHDSKTPVAPATKSQVEAEAFRMITVVRQLQQIPAVGNCSKITMPGKDLFRLISELEAAVARGDKEFTALRADVEPWLRFVGRHFPNFEKRARLFLDSPAAQTMDDVNTEELRTLIVVPAALIHQWHSEIKHKLKPERKPQIAIYHTKSILETTQAVTAASLEAHDFVLTTYEMLVRGAAPGWTSGLSGVATAAPTTSFDRSKAAPLFQVRWKRIILDEAHVIRNPATARWKAVELLDGVKRWAVTATPLHNSILDLQTLMKFTGNALLPIQNMTSGNAANDFVIRDKTLQRSVARALMPTMLRRSPVQSRNGITEVLVKLPEKTETIVRLQFTDAEATMYNAILARSKNQLASAVKDKLAFHVFAMMIRLRQACLHPILHDGKSLEVYLCGVCKNQATDVLLTKCGHAFCYDCLSSKFEEQSALEQAVRIPCPECQHPVSSSVFKKSVTSPMRLQRIRSRPFVPSTKVTALLDAVKNIRTNYPNDKVVIFSQFTGMLDVLTVGLEQMGVATARLDGSMPLDSRAAVIRQFQSVDTVPVLLASKFAVGVGLNLTAANHVLVADPWWNPAMEEQAVHRCHRIGQTKPVFVTRFAISDSIEDYCLGIALKKKRFGDAVLSAVSDADFASTSTMIADVQKLNFVTPKS